jgi:hypothetical protein
MGVGLTVLSSGALAGRRGDKEQSPWDPTLFFFLAVQLIGFCVVGAALYVLGWSIETGHQLGPQDLRAEKQFIMALLLLFVITAVFKAWIEHIYSPDNRPWEQGFMERGAQLIGFIMALLIVILVGLSVDESLISGAKVDNATATFLIAGILIAALGASWLLLRRLSGGDPSPQAWSRSLHQQQRLLQALQEAPGYLISVEVRAVVDLEPSLALPAVVWVTQLGWYWLTDSAYELSRYHAWAADHALLPTRALHAQRVSVFAGLKPASMRGMRITPTMRRRLSLKERFRAHRENPPPPADASPPERKAGLIYISPEQLRQAGLQVKITGETREK